MSGRDVAVAVRGAPRVPYCAEIARADGYLPAGTAASSPVFLLVEAPLPWPSEVTEHPLLQPVAPVAAAHRARVQAVVPDHLVAPTPHGMTRVVAYRRPDGPFTRYLRDEHVVPTAELAREVAGILDDPARRRAGDAADAHAAHDTADAHAAHDLVDVLVCTHGRRDVCCGRDGFRTHRDLTALRLPGVRVWRTSHTGGHRFAPTAVTFPDGRAWASVDGATLAGIVTRSLGPTEAQRHDRGCAAFADAFAQAADGAVLGLEGWSWLDRAREVEIEVVAEDRRAVTVTGTTAGADEVAYRAEVVVRRVVPVPDCGRPIEDARKSSPELEVATLTRA